MAASALLDRHVDVLAAAGARGAAKSAPSDATAALSAALELGLLAEGA